MHGIEYVYRPVTYVLGEAVIETPEGREPHAWAVYRRGLNGLSFIVEEYKTKAAAVQVAATLNWNAPAVRIDWREKAELEEYLSELHIKRTF